MNIFVLKANGQQKQPVYLPVVQLRNFNKRSVTELQATLIVRLLNKCTLTKFGTSHKYIFLKGLNIKMKW